MKRKLKRRYAVFITASLKAAALDEMRLADRLDMMRAYNQHSMLQREQRRYGTVERPDLAQHYGAPEGQGWTPILSGRGKFLYWTMDFDVTEPTGE